VLKVEDLEPVHRAAEEQRESRTASPELGRGRKRQVDLKAARQQEHSVDRRPAGKIEQVDSLELTSEVARPVAKHLRDGHTVHDAESEVEVRPAIAPAAGSPAHQRPGDYTRVRRRHREHALADTVTLGDGEHDPIIPRAERADQGRSSS